tara:strand:+ start:1216 stop:1557 length:342 start_codon:yes stop_codon:yes gene_type:complete
MNKKEYKLYFNTQEINLILKAMHKTFPITDKRQILINIETKLYNAKQKLNNKNFLTKEQLDKENNQAILNAEDPNYPIGDNGTYDYFADKLDKLSREVVALLKSKNKKQNVGN